jgi:hypothetical protein
MEDWELDYIKEDIASFDTKDDTRLITTVTSVLSDVEKKLPYNDVNSTHVSVILNKLVSSINLSIELGYDVHVSTLLRDMAVSEKELTSEATNALVEVNKANIPRTLYYTYLDLIKVTNVKLASKAMYVVGRMLSSSMLNEPKNKDSAVETEG